MWDLKLQIVYNFLLILNVIIINLISMGLEFITPILMNGFDLINFACNYFFSQNLTIFLVIKFLFCIGFLILIRGGTPRYRYDYLTKLGWLKFIGLVLFVFLNTIIVFFLF